MSALGKERDGIEKLANLVPGVRVPEHRQTEGRLGDEHVAGDHLIGQAGRIAGALVVARDDHAGPARLDDDLGRSQHMAGGRETHGHVPDPDILAQGRCLPRPGKILAVAQRP